MRTHEQINVESLNNIAYDIAETCPPASRAILNATKEVEHLRLECSLLRLEINYNAAQKDSPNDKA